MERVSRKTVQKYEVSGETYHVAAIDCGMKQNIGAVFQPQRLQCDGVSLEYFCGRNRRHKARWIFCPMDREIQADARPVIELVKKLRGKYPMFGICLGHQIISLAYGARTYKLRFGHRGGNHPVKNLETGKIEITSQNHSYAVDAESLSGTGLEATHFNLLDQTIEGAACREDRVFSVQYHPESAPGPQDSGYLFDQFIDRMEETKLAKTN